MKIQESKKYLNYVLREGFTKNKLGYVILFVTSKCNARCNHCFYWKSLKGQKDLSFKEIKQIFSKLGNFSTLLVSGGEPFLRKDLVEICSFITHNNELQQIIIPTNAILTNKIVNTTKRLCKLLPKVLISVNISFDGLQQKHNKIRGLDCFNSVVDTLHALSKLGIHNLQINVNTVVSNQNYKELPKIMEYISKYDITSHNIELIRGDPKSKKFELPPLEEIQKVHNVVMRYKAKQISKTGFINRMVVLGSLYYQFRLKELVLKGKKFPFTCKAGKGIIVINSNGDLALCELLKPIANLRDYDYNPKNILELPKAKRMLEQIKRTRCSCIHICFLNVSLAKDWHSLYQVPRYWLKWKLA